MCWLESRFRKILEKHGRCRKILEKHGLILTARDAYRRKHSKLLLESLKKFGVTFYEHRVLFAYVDARVPYEKAYAEEQGIQTSVIELQTMLAFHISARKGDEKYVRSLLHYGVDPNRRDSEGSVALWEAMVGGHIKMVQLLIENGANLFSGNMGQFAWTASQHNKLDLLKEFVFLGGDVTHSNIDGKTALSAAVCNSNINIVQFLLDQGADGPPGQNAHEYIRRNRIVKLKACHQKHPEKFILDTPVPSEGTLVEKHVMRRSNVHYFGGNSTRVTVSCLQSDDAPKLVGLPQSLEELLEFSSAKFGIVATKVLTKDKAEIDDISLIRDGDHLILAGD